MSFESTLNAFCDALSLTFPELEGISRAKLTSPSVFWNSWVGTLDILLESDSGRLFGARKGFIVGAIRLTPALWASVSDNTQNSIWRYLRTLCLESAKEVGIETMSAETLGMLNSILVAEQLASDPSGLFEESFKNLQPMVDRIKEMMGEDFAKDPEAFKLPEIPAHLKSGVIARLAEVLVKQLDPAEFGIDPALLKTDKPQELFQTLLEMYQKDPGPMTAGLKRLSEKIQAQIKGGSLNKEQVIAEAKEYYELFKDHPLVKKAMDKFKGAGPAAEVFSAMMAGGSAGEPSERRRIVQERLRKKMAERQAAKK